MEGARTLLARLWDALSSAVRQVVDSGRNRAIVAASALCLLALTATMLALSFAAPGQSVSPAATEAASGGSNFQLPKLAAAHTPTPPPTATPQPTQSLPVAPVSKKASSAPVDVPPPPQPPPPPSTPSPTPCPTVAPTATAPTSATATATATGSPTVTGAPSPTGTGTPTGTATTSSGAGAAGLPLAARSSLPPSCTPCGQHAGNNPSQPDIAAALQSAAARYQLPVNLVYGFAWEESQWHQDVITCDGGVGLMQIQYYYQDYFNSDPAIAGECGLGTTSYDIYTLQGNADLGAKVIKYLACYYMGTAQGKYSGAGLAFPDGNLCTQLWNNNSNGPTTTLYQDLPSSVSDGWSCPLDPTQGITSYEVLDYTASAYNAGQTAIYKCKCIPNLGYVGAVEYWTTEFRQGILPRAS